MAGHPNAVDAQQPVDQTGRCVAGPWLACASGYLLLAVVVTFPVVLHLRRDVIGGFRDVWVMLWSNWWFVEALTHYHVSPYFCPLVWHPFGMEMHLLEIRLFPATLFLLIQPFFGLVVAHNVAMLLGIAASGLGTHVLAYHLTRNHVASFIGGTSFCVSTYLLATVTNGWVHLAHAEWLPLYAWAVLRMSESPSLRRGALAGTLLCLAMHTAWYYGIYLTFFSLTFGLYMLATARGKVLNRAFIWATAVLCLVVLAGVLPVALPSMLKTASGQIAAEVELPSVPAGLVEYLVPVYEQIRDRADSYAYTTTYIGFVTLGLAVFGVVRGRAAGRRCGLWLCVAGVSFVLALGSHLHLFMDQPVEIAGHRVPLPDLLLRKVLPFYGMGRNQWRHHAVFCMALSVLVAFGAERLLRRTGRPGRALWPKVVGIVALFFVEACWIGPLPVPVPLSDGRPPVVYRPLVRTRDDFAVVVSPLSYKALYYQTYHRRPIVGYTCVLKQHAPDQVERTKQMFGAAVRALDRSPSTLRSELDEAREVLLREGVGYIVEHSPEGDRLIVVLGKGDRVGE